MAKITKQEVKHIAKLARLNLGDKEVEKFEKELSLVLDYIKVLDEVDVSTIEPTSHPFKIKNTARKDEPVLDKNNDQAEKIIGLAPDTKNNYLKVKPILK